MNNIIHLFQTDCLEGVVLLKLLDFEPALISKDLGSESGARSLALDLNLLRLKLPFTEFYICSLWNPLITLIFLNPPRKGGAIPAEPQREGGLVLVLSEPGGECDVWEPEWGWGRCFQAVSSNILARKNVLTNPHRPGIWKRPPQEAHRLEMMPHPPPPERYPAAAVSGEPQTCLELRRAETYQRWMTGGGDSPDGGAGVTAPGSTELGLVRVGFLPSVHFLILVVIDEHWLDPSFQWKWNLVTQSCPTLCDPVDCSPPGSSVHGILQARVLQWVAISFSRGSSQPRDQTQVSDIAGRVFIIWAAREPIISLGFAKWRYSTIPISSLS